MNTIENIARICALGLMVSAANAETVKFKDWPDNPTHNWSDTSSWEGGVAPGAGDDVLFDYGQYMVITDSFTIKSFAVNNTSWNPGGIRTISGDTPPDLSAWKAPSLNILEDVNISAAENTLGAEYTFTFGSANYRRGFNQISVGGNFLYKGYGVLTFGFAPNVEYSRDHYSLDIGGILTASVGEDWGNWSYKRRIIINKCGNDNSAASETVDAFVRLGGLAGGGIISNNDPGALSTTIVFQARPGKAFSGGDFSGRFTKFWGAENSTMKIIMDAGSGSAQQSIRLINRYGDSSDADLNSLEFEVQSGTLGLSTNKADGIKIDGVSLIGGTLKVVEAADHLDVRDNGHGGVYEAGDSAENALKNADYSYLNVENFDWQGGNVAMYIDSLVAGVLLNVGTFTGSGTYNFVFDYKDAEDLLNIKDLAIFTAAVSEGATGDMFKGVTSDGLYDAVFKWENGTLSIVEFVAVPEPSTIAAVLGAFALAMAARRRGK